MIRAANRFHGLMREQVAGGPWLHMPRGIAGHVRSRAQPPAYRLVRWADLRCSTEEQVGPFRVKTDCAVGRSAPKFFVRLGRRRLRDLRDYARLVRAGVITAADTRALLARMQRDLPTAHVLINDNMEVGVLHFKARPRPTAELPPRRARDALSRGQDDLADMIKATIEDNKVVIYSKSSCPHCAATLSLFEQQHPDVTRTVIQLDLIPNGNLLQVALAKFTQQKSVPNVFINGKHIGGNEDTQRAHRSGKLRAMLQRA